MANLRADNLTGTGGRNAIDGSVFFGGADDYLVCTDNSDFALGTGDFTVEAWFLVDTNLDYRSLIDTRTSVNDDWMIGIRSNDRIYVYAGAFLVESPTGSVTPGHWHHVAYVRSSGTHALYFNGVSVATSSTSKDYDSQKLAISAPPYNVGAEEFKGYVSNVRIIKGTALYTAAFTPPTEKLTAVDGTVLLCCQDSDNPIQEVTGKTITGYGNLAAFSSGDNLVTNGTFDSATTGWTSDGTIAIDSNRLKITNDTTAYRSASQDITVVVGKAYRVSADCIAGTSNNSNFHVGTTSSSNALASAVTSPVVVRPTVTTLRVTLNVGSNTSGHTALYDNVEVREVEPSKAPKVLPSVGVDEGVTFEGDTKINSKNYMYFPTGDTSQRGRGRGLNGGSSTPSNITNIDYFQIQSTGNSIDFGDLTVAGQHTACSSTTRGVFAMGSNNNTIDYVTIATTANAVDFGDRTIAKNGPGALSNNVRGVFCGGGAPNPQSDVMDYITIASTGNATDFGNMSAGNKNACGLASPTRGCIALGGDPLTNTIDYITIASTGNASDFGDTVQAGEGYLACASNIRGIWTGGYVAPANQNVIQYVTIASTGNAADFGDLGSNRVTAQSGAGTSNNLRGVTMGGFNNPNQFSTTMEYVTIATTGNAVDFGDTVVPVYGAPGLSDCHGGLS